MSDLLSLTDLELKTRIGITDAERSSPQIILVSVSFPIDASLAAATDDLKQLIDYDMVWKAVLELASQERKTLERLAEDIASTLLRKFPLPSVEVTVKKKPFGDDSVAELKIKRS